MFGLLDGLKMGGAALLAAILVAPVAHYVGQRAGRQEAAAEALEKSLELIQSREQTNAEISSADAAALCAHFELPDAERLECVRRVAAAVSKP